MSWSTVIRELVVWYVVVQMVMVATLPLSLRVLRALPDNGFSFAKISGVLVVGVVYWLGYSYGLLRNERGGIWLVLVGVATISWVVGWAEVTAWWRSLRAGGRLRAIIVTELVFALAFVAWTVVRAHDPNIDHTEQPMDLMFLNSIWASATYPPRDAWLAGYAISYYYFGYWLLATLTRLANTPPEVAYNVGQAVWYGLLWSGCFGVVMNLLAWRLGRDEVEPRATDDVSRNVPNDDSKIPALSLVGGLLGGISVAFVGNLQVILEWLYAQGVNVAGIARWVDVHNFPENATQSGLWYIDMGWWWWRSSRVIEDVDLLGNHIDISPIDEFPMFSYLLGDNHPHVLAMPVVLLVIGLALNYLLLFTQRQNDGQGEPRAWGIGGLPLRMDDVAFIVMAVGSLVFLNTWDFPPYWLLLAAVTLLGRGADWRRALAVGGAVVLGTVAIYFPYFLTAQSQAGGIVPNVFNPTRLPQFLVMFGGFLPAVTGVVVLGWRLARPRGATLLWVAALVLGVPVAFLALSAALASSAWGAGQLARMELPPGATSYAAVILQRWMSEPWTLLFVGALLTVLVAMLIALLNRPVQAWYGSADLVFVLLMGTIGVAWVYAPEFVYLRDNFGSRMNTVFKFYYQGWLLMGLCCAYLMTVAISRAPRRVGAVEALAAVSLVLITGSALFPIAGTYAKTGGFTRAEPTLDGTQYVAQGIPDVMAAALWVRENTTAEEIVLEGKGNSYAAHHNRISTMTGRATLLGWDGHQSQWRGEAFGTMAQGRNQAIEGVYRTAAVEEIPTLLEEWGIDYVFVGPSEIELYGITAFRMEELSASMDTVFARGQVRIFRRREG